MVISFSVINYVVNEASSRERRSLILFYTPLYKALTLNDIKNRHSFTGHDGQRIGYRLTLL